MTSHIITNKACEYVVTNFKCHESYSRLEIGDWFLIDFIRFDDQDFGLVASKSLYCAPDLGGRERFVYVETNYGDVVDIRWDNTPDRFLNLFD
jgi:hypothetical protein